MTDLLGFVLESNRIEGIHRGISDWLWQIGGIEQVPLGFLHHWYYSSLQEATDGIG